MRRLNEMKPPRLRRQDCPKGKSFYLCATSQFRGCCSVDPCNLISGCPDPGSSTTQSSIAATSSTASQGRTTDATITSSSRPPSTTTSSTGRDTTTVTTTPTNVNVVHSSGPSSRQNGSTKGLIGLGAGLVLIIVVLIVAGCWWRRRRRRQRGRPSSHPTAGPHYHPAPGGREIPEDEDETTSNGGFFSSVSSRSFPVQGFFSACSRRGASANHMVTWEIQRSSVDRQHRIQSD